MGDFSARDLVYHQGIGCPWIRTAVGTVPTQIDYADYRDVAGVKIPFRSIVTWTDGQNTIQLSEVRPNVAIETARFARPAPFKRR